MTSLIRLLLTGETLVAFALLAYTARIQAAASPAGSGSETPFALGVQAQPKSEIDRIVFAQLERSGIRLAHPCTDAVFLRRVHLDLCGTLPTAAEAREFLADRRVDRRERLVDRLLARDAHVDYFTLKWCDLLRVKAEFPVNLWPNAAQAYHRWIYSAVRDNLPYDAFVRALITASGSNFRSGPANFLRAVPKRDANSLAKATALVFLCARAEYWPREQLDGLAAFFTGVAYKATSEWKEEIVYFDGAKLPSGPDAWTGHLPDGSVISLPPEADPRTALAAWLTSPNNAAFARAHANRVWSWMMGRGIVHEPDDFRPDNPPVNPALLDALADELVRSGWDTTQLVRTIANSQTYQLASTPASTDPRAEANFAFYAPRRLDAEVLIDALNQITGTTESYSSAIPEPFTFVPDHVSAIALPDGSITSTFLERFGRPGRDTGLASERNNRVTAQQRLHLLNSTHVQRKIEQGPGLQALRQRPIRECVEGLYLTVLSRLPTDTERGQAIAYASARKGDSRSCFNDLAWALLNSPEFLFCH